MIGLDPPQGRAGVAHRRRDAFLLGRDRRASPMVEVDGDKEPHRGSGTKPRRHEGMHRKVLRVFVSSWRIQRVAGQKGASFFSNSRRSMFIAACADWNFTISRPPRN